MHDAGIFLKNYISFVEELPNDVQRCISKFRELDCKTKNLITEVEKICEHILTAKSSKQASMKMQQILVKITELKDEKIQLSQSLTSHIENKYKSVADSYQSNVTVKQERSPTPKIMPSINPQPINPPKNLNSSAATTSSTSSATECQEKPTKRIRKTRIDNLDVDSTDESIIPPVKSVEKPLQSTSNATKRGTATNNQAKKAKKRKQTKKQSAQAAHDPIDEVIQDDNITDETTYCICQQISYGEMIFCENDTCPIEWFHFSCVDLTAKPKGRWFCPQCRGDKPNVINKKWRKKQQESSI